MNNKNILYSIEGYQESTIKIKRSIFTCRFAHVTSIDLAKQFTRRISKENKRATHNCWAYVLGDKAQIYHSSDAGEPSGTAGKPMLNTLQKNSMTQIAAVVTRYFGGVKLGVRGLMDAYSASVQETIDIKKRKRLIQTVCFDINVSYGFNDTLLNQLDPYLSRIKDSVYTDIITHKIDIAKENSRFVVKLLEESQSMGKLKFELIKES